jgi:Ni,Fe-hydrogenase III large subunit
MRRSCPYSGYEQYQFEVPCEQEGDGYARLRVLFSEAQQSARLIHEAVAHLEAGEICTVIRDIPSGASTGWTEAPIGGSVHWLRLDGRGRVERYRLSPSFRNWLGLHVAVEDFAFQDFPIILATFGLSAPECDR